MGQFLSPLQLTLIHEATGSERAKYILSAPLCYKSRHLRDAVIVPTGFITDLASVPRIPLAWLIAGGIGDRAAVIHDYLYAETKVRRGTADAVFLEALLDTGVSAWRARAMWAAVRAFGWVARRK